MGLGVGGSNEGPGTDYVISGSIRGLKKTAPDGANTQTDGQVIHRHGDSIAELADSVRNKLAAQAADTDLSPLKLHKNAKSAHSAKLP